MTDEERIEIYLRRSGCVAQSLDAMRTDFPRWVRHLRERGVTRIPVSPWWLTPEDTLAANLIGQFAMQHPGCKNPDKASVGHSQRNRTGTRPYKP